MFQEIAYINRVYTNYELARNQKFFRAGKVSWNWGTTINILSNGKFNLRMDTIRAFPPPKIRVLFLIFKKGQGKPTPPTFHLPSCAPDELSNLKHITDFDVSFIVCYSWKYQEKFGKVWNEKPYETNNKILCKWRLNCYLSKYYRKTKVKKH